MCCEHQVLISREFENDLHLEENVPLCCGDVVYPGQVGHVLEVGGLDDVGLGRHVVRLQGQVVGRGLERTPGDVEELLGRHQRPAVRGHARLEVELETKGHTEFRVITEKAPTRAFSWLKA